LSENAFGAVSSASKKCLDFLFNYALPAKLDKHKLDHLAGCGVSPPFAGRIGHFGIGHSKR
jgi:hypothetical protein